MNADPRVTAIKHCYQNSINTFDACVNEYNSRWFVWGKSPIHCCVEKDRAFFRCLGDEFDKLDTAQAKIDNPK